MTAGTVYSIHISLYMNRDKKCPEYAQFLHFLLSMCDLECLLLVVVVVLRFCGVSSVSHRVSRGFFPPSGLLKAV